MGKKRIATKEGAEGEGQAKGAAKSSRKRVGAGILYVKSTYNNTVVSLTDPKGNILMASSSGALGFKGAKKGTPFAASKVGDILSEKAAVVGLAEIDVVINGVGSGREAAVRSFTSRGITINSIRDITPIPHNGPRPKKPRRV